LATIRQHVELAQAHPDVTSVEELAGIVHAEGMRLQGLVDALLLLAGLDEGAAITHEFVDLDDIALVEVSRLRAAGIVVDGSGVGPAQVSGDRRLLGQLVRNLTDNAARHAHSRVAIGVVDRDGSAVLTVEDDGDGVPADQRDRIFERFVRLDEARSRDAGGSGLGLPIVHAIAEAFGGRVAVDASRWGGARFTVTLPTAS
jgi:signal transduction histidine kinase